MRPKLVGNLAVVMTGSTIRICTVPSPSRWAELNCCVGHVTTDDVYVCSYAPE